MTWLKVKAMVRRRFLVVAWVGCAVLGSARTLVAQEEPESRFFFAINFGQQGSSSNFTDDVDFTLHAETGDFSATYDLDDGAFLDVSGGVRIKRKLALGLAISSFDENLRASVSARIPHPFFFDSHREIGGVASNLKREETAIHFHVIWIIPVNGRVDLKLFAGPTLFDVSQNVVVDVAFADTFPFDTATFTGANVKEVSESKVGFNLGVDVAFYFSGHLGVGLLARFSETTVDLSVDGRTFPIDVGGLQAGAGFRLRF